MVYKNIPAALTLHWTDGFLLKPFASPTFAFTYSFSQLKGSSDDGNATLTLLFQEPDARDHDLVEQVRKIYCYFKINSIDFFVIKISMYCSNSFKLMILFLLL